MRISTFFSCTFPITCLRSLWLRISANKDSIIPDPKQLENDGQSLVTRSIQAQKSRWPISLPALVILLTLLARVSQAQYIQNSTLLGTSANDYTNRMQVVNGETYILGVANSTNYPVTNGSTYRGGQDLVITKLNAAGNIVYSTYLGGSSFEADGYFKVVNGEVYIFGNTGSNDFPVTNGSTFGGTTDAQLTKLNASGNIVFSTYLGGNGQDSPSGIEVVNGEIHLLFNTLSTNFPVTNGSTFGGGSDIAYMKLSASGNILFSTYLGGSENDTSSPNIKVSGGKVYIVGYTESPNFPVTNGSTYNGGTDVFYTRLSASGTIEFSSYYGGTAYDEAINFDFENGEAYLIVTTYSSDFPVTNGSSINNNELDMVYMKINSSDAVAFASYVGGSGVEVTTDLKVINGEGYFVGYTDSPDYPVTNGSVFGGITDIVYTKFAANGTIAVSTYIAANRLERAYGFDVVDGEIHIVGTTESTVSNYPVTNGTRPRTLTDNGVYTKLDASTGQILYSTIYAGTNATTPRIIQVENGVAYITGSAGSGYPTTDGSIAKNTTDIFFATFKLCGTFPSTPATITPASQTVCQNGFTQLLTGTTVAIPSSDVPTLYRNGIPEQQPQIQAFYQWQQATSPGGPWTDIAGATQKDYNPGPSPVTRYFRRISTSGPCCGNAVVNTSAVASIIISASAAPTLAVTDVFNTCVGSPVVIGGSPTASGGTTPYTYAWDNGAAAVANPTVNPSITTIYTLTVTDANGCRQIDQTLVNVYAAYAGADVGSCAGTPVQIGGAPIPGVPGVTYSWAPATGLSCTTCAQPFANPSTPTTYTLTLTVPITGGGTCQSTDAVVVTPVAAPLTPNFAGPDVTICIGNTATIGTTAESGFTYTWAPGNYLTANNTARTTFQPGSLAMPTPNPITYYVTALKNGCTFVDQMQASVIEARAGVDGCGPRNVGEPDRTPNIGETYTWTKLSGPGNFVGPTNLPQVPVTASVGGATTYRLTVSYNGTTCTDDVVVPDCGCVVDIKVDAPFACPSFGLNGGNVKLIATAADIYSTDPNVFTYTWSPAAGLSSTTGREVTLTDNVQRTYTVTMSSPFDPSFACTRTITVNNPAWSLPVFTAQDVSTCPAVPVQIGAPPVAGYAYAWTGSVLSSTAVSNPTATVTNTTLFAVRVTDVGSGCITRDTVQVSLAAAAADAGPNKSVCPSGIVTIGTPAQPNTTYSWSPAGANWQNGTNQNSAQPQVLVAVTTVFSVTATNTQSNCTSVDQVTVTAGSAIPSFTLPNITYCPGNGPVSLGGTAPTGTGYTYSWAPAGLVTIATTNATTTRTPPPSTPTTFTLTVRNAAGCEQVATQTITPTNTAPNPGSNQVMCLGNSVSLGSASNPTGGGITYNWTPATGLSSASSPNPTFTPTAAGVFSFTLTKTEGACSSPATVTVTVNSFTLAAIPSVAVCQGACTTIGTTPIANVQYSWSPTTGLSDPNSATTIACVNSSTTYTLTAINLSGCVATRQVLVGVNNSPAPSINIPSVTACLGSPSTTFNPVVSPSGSYNYVWSPNDGTLNNIYASNPTVNVTNVGTKTYSLTVTNTATGCSSSQLAQLDVEICCVKPDAGQDISICPPATTAQLNPGTSGGTWTAQAGNPAAATVSASGAVSGMTANGIYRFIYSVSTNGTTCTDTVAVSRLQPLSMVVTPGVCQSATNQYTISGTVSLTNAIAGTLTITDGTQSTTVAVSSGSSSVPFSFTGLTSGSGSHTVTASLSSCGSTSATYTAPASCTGNVAISVTPGTCVPATNQYSISGTLSFTNATAGTATITDGINSTTVAVSAGATSVPYSLTGLTSGTGSHTVTVTYAGKTASTTYTAPASCLVGVAISVTPGACVPATNQYSISGILSLTNAVAGTAIITDGINSTTVTISAGATSVPYSLAGLSSGTGSHTVTVSYAGNTASATYTAPVSCLVGVAISATPGACVPATNQYSVSGTLSLTNAVAGTATITDGATSTTVAVSAGATSVPYSLTGFTSGTGSHTVTVSYAAQTASATYAAPVSCSVNVAISVTPGVCVPATNQYSVSGTLSLTNAVAGTATITDGINSTTVAVSAGTTSVPYSLTGLTSGTGSHTVTVSYASKTASATYTAPASCTVGVAITATPSVCDPLTNQYSVSGTLSLTNAVAGTATITDGATSTTVAVSAGATSVPYSLTGFTSGTGSHTVTVSYAAQTASATYAAPVSCSVNVAISVTPGACVPATNQYSISGTLSLTNAIAGTATITDGTSTTTVSVSAGQTSVAYSLAGLNSGTGSHTVTVSYASQTASITYTAPASCTLGVALVITPGVCQSATNSYTLTGTLSLTNAQAGNATFTDGT
ncbi:beta strand repeat-containing protein, partial [Spirosoma terrae]